MSRSVGYRHMKASGRTGLQPHLDEQRFSVPVGMCEGHESATDEHEKRHHWDRLHFPISGVAVCQSPPPSAGGKRCRIVFVPEEAVTCDSLTRLQLQHITEMSLQSVRARRCKLLHVSVWEEK
ncbi:hypothetical protein NQZ68_007654 [Dissostichus eleginoides]|nr:hypothetical protein NQZ68_007654 [Dissostichus eleginoides]